MWKELIVASPAGLVGFDAHNCAKAWGAGHFFRTLHGAWSSSALAKVPKICSHSPLSAFGRLTLSSAMGARCRGRIGAVAAAGVAGIVRDDGCCRALGLVLLIILAAVPLAVADVPIYGRPGIKDIKGAE